MELIKDKWYKYTTTNRGKILYFKFEKNIENEIFCYNNIIYLEKYREFSSVLQYENNVEEIDFSIIVDYLPTDHIDYKYFYRKRKIESLLK